MIEVTVLGVDVTVPGFAMLPAPGLDAAGVTTGAETETKVVIGTLESELEPPPPPHADKATKQAPINRSRLSA
jgi:hypothetical protein